MRRNADNPRVRLWGVAAIVLAAAFLLVSVRSGTAATEFDTTDTPVIDTAAAVDPQQCAPCHLDLSSVDKPGLVFNHGSHLMVSCDGCHSRMPHQEGITESVPMEVCYACHGVQHGPQGELAGSECRKCHTEGFDLVPTDHQPIDQFAGKPHAERAKRLGNNDCMMCHTASKDCNPCHVEKAVKIDPLPDSYASVVRERPKGPSIKIYPQGPTNMAQCVYCHPDLDSIVPGRLIFAHAEHLQRAYPCEACHPKFGHNEAGVAVPDMMSCYRCHGLQHQGQGVIATDDCGACHPKEFDLVPVNHTPKFIAGEHKVRAGEDPAYCAMCHTTQFCIDCHTGKNATGKPIVPEDHKKSTWLKRHGPLYLQRKGDCGACHTTKSCTRCHKTSMPHPPGWIQNHKPEPGVSSEDCNVCHTDRETCQNCHHLGVKNAELIAENCVKCHPQMTQQPPTSIPNKGFAEHAVHFNVAESKGRPYRCYECHISFGTSEAARQVELQQGHDLRLCYQCHGAVDALNREIAPYKGAELCLQCHTELGV